MTKKTANYDTVIYGQSLVRMAQNENPYGTSPKAIEAIQIHSSEISQYPDNEYTELRSILADKLSVHKANIFIGAGSVSLIEILMRALVKKEEHIVFPKISFTAYKIIAKFCNIEHRIADMKDFKIDLDAVAKLCNPQTKLVFLANPNNPTGTIFRNDELKRFMEQVHRDTIVVIDEAYVEYANDTEFPNAIDYFKNYPNVIVLRSLSKIYGLAGLRIGYGIISDSVSEIIQSQRIPFTVNKLASTAAVAALKDVDFLQSCIKKNDEQREFVFENLIRMGYNAIPSQTNFFFLSFNTTSERDSCYDFLIEAGMQTRKMEHFGDNTAIRISLGNKAVNEKLIESLNQYCSK